MKVTLQKAIVLQGNLLCALKIEGPGGGWIKFAEVCVPLSQVPWDRVWAEWQRTTASGPDDSQEMLWD